MHELLVEQFVASHKKVPKELILDFDATDDAVHGKQDGRFFHGYYDQYCFRPLDRHGVFYVLGLAQNARLNALAQKHLDRAERGHRKTGERQRFFKEFRYAAQTWDRKRRVILRAEHSDKGSNPRSIVTNLDTAADILYDNVSCARGEMENRIKEQQVDLFSDRTSCSKWWANPFRLPLSRLAYVLLESIRRVALQKSDLARATCGTIRLKLLKIGAVLIRNTRRIRLHRSHAFAHRDLFHLVCQRLSTA